MLLGLPCVRDTSYFACAKNHREVFRQILCRRSEKKLHSTEVLQGCVAFARYVLIWVSFAQFDLIDVPVIVETLDQDANAV